MSSGIEDPGLMLQAAVDKIAAVAKDRAFIGFKKLLFDIQSGATRLSRVDTGWYRANWFVSINQAPGGTVATPADSRAPLARRKARVQRGSRPLKALRPRKRPAAITSSGGVTGELDPKADINTAYIHNNVVYAAFLEAKYKPLARAVEQRTRAIR